MYQFNIQDCFDDTIKNIGIEATQINEPIENIIETFYNLFMLGYKLKQLNEKIKVLPKDTNWFSVFGKSLYTYPAALASIQLNGNVKKLVNKEVFKIYPALTNLVEALGEYNAAEITRDKAQQSDAAVFNDLITNGKIQIVGKSRELRKTDLNTISQIFHQLPIVAAFDNPNVVQFNDLTQNQHIFICYALKKSQDIIEINHNTATALFTLDENFTAYQIEKEFGFSRGFLGGKKFINDVVKLNFMKIAFMIDTVILPISVVNIGYDTATNKHKFQLSADFLQQKKLIEQYRRFYNVKKLTGLSISQLFSSRQKVSDIFMAMRLINETEIRQRDGNPYDFNKLMSQYNWDISNVEVTKRKLRRLFNFLNYKVQFFKANGHDFFALDKA